MAGFGSSAVRSLCELPVVKHEEVQCCMWCTNSAVGSELAVLHCANMATGLCNETTVTKLQRGFDFSCTY